MTKTAVILFNLGGPDSEEAVRPFLQNLFSDKAIIRLPAPFRQMLAWLIAKRRAPIARNIYAEIGGSSPINPLTEQQAMALEERLNQQGADHKVFYSMRYWHPFSDEIARRVKDYQPKRIVLLPLYPQFSTTTTASSFANWHRVAKKAGIIAPTHAICCYPTEKNFLAAHVDLLRAAYWKASDKGTPRILFSAHGLPEKIVQAGDPYVWQVEKSAQAIMQLIAIDDADFRICYQSRVGPLKWTSPSTEEELEQAGKDGVSVVLVPIAFVSEHSETLVELDIEYRELAFKQGVKDYVRVPALGVNDFYVESLAALCQSALKYGPRTCSYNGERLCPKPFSQCAYQGDEDDG